jgi:ribosome maturation factor RimP
MRLDPRITDDIRAIAESEGAQLLAVETTGAGPQTVLRVVVDGPSGVTLDQCASISRQASALLDVEDPVGHRYTLEVSSPGMDRKLYSPEDYERFAGRRVRARTAPGSGSARQIAGELLGLRDQCVRLAVERDEIVELPLADVFEVRLEVDWGQVMKKGSNRR